MPWLYLNRRSKDQNLPMTVLISQHRDGQLVARVMKCLGIDSIAGSSTRGGREALFKLIALLQRKGSQISIAPDGPNGPQYIVKEGLMRIAQRSGSLIYPTTYSAESYCRFSSWDGMILPKPFSRAV
ncbi:MAG: lysophospholipid acyltransferase family protein [bacterium]